MRLLIVLSLLAVAASATASDLGSAAPAKRAPMVAPNLPHSARLAGDTVETAAVIGSIPFIDDRTTAGYNDDYEESCPYTSTSADYVYVFTPAFDVTCTIDLCGSDYDTKVFVYDANLNLLACNDDFYSDDPCGVYVSRIDAVALPGGEPSYIVIDGYGGDYGPYHLEVTEVIGEEVECPAGGELESEPPLVDDYVDTHNGGCNAPPDFPFQNLLSIYGGELDLCGASGWYSFQGSSYRDTDWFRIVMGYTGVITAELFVEYDTYLFELGPQDCDNVALIQSATAQQLSPAMMTITGYDFGADVWIWVGPTVFTPPSPDIHQYDYVLSLSGLDFPIAVEAATWSTVKALYQ